jgi:hypothetical protein
MIVIGLNDTLPIVVSPIVYHLFKCVNSEGDSDVARLTNDQYIDSMMKPKL